MAKDAVATMGGLLPDDTGGRDAVHVAVFSAVSDEKLFPGQDVAIIERGEPDNKVSAKAIDLIAIVDPFLKGAVAPGARFWAYLYPRTITSLSHRWGHPAFSDNAALTYVPPSQKLDSEEWLRNFCSTNDCPGYDTVMRVIKNGSFDDGDDCSGRIDGEYIHFNGMDAHAEIPAEFWVHVENVLGEKVAQKPGYFSCSC